MSSPFTLFEISWEVCNKVGGIHTVLASKAQTLVERFGDEYVTIGPWLLSDPDRDTPFDEDPAFTEFSESCRAMGIPVRVGRWRIPSAPRAILVEFSSLYDQKDDILAELWEHFGVDSISGDWDYVEPVLFGYAVGRVIEKWWEEYLDPQHRRGVAHAHEWMTGSSLLYLRQRVPALGTCFTTHATMLGRALSSTGYSPDDGLGDNTADELAETHGVKAKHSLEGICARQADTFTTVSTITAKEAELLHGRAPEPVTPNGIDLDVIDTIAGSHGREEVRTRLLQLAARFLGEDVQDAALLATSGRYEFHNKGFDLLLEALAALDAEEGRRIVLFVLAPAGNSGINAELTERLGKDLAAIDGPMGLCTHNLFEPERDPLQEACARLGLDNAHDARVRVIHVPIYLAEDDGFLNLPYEAVLRAMDLSCFPSYYEPWGYTPQESLALGVPTITTDYAGFGRWAEEAGLGPAEGVTVLPRVHVSHEAIRQALADEISRFLAEGRSPEELAAACRASAARTAWSDFIANYDRAYASALDAVQARLVAGAQKTRRPRRVLRVQPSPEGERPRLFRFDVSATLPKSLAGLMRLARNYWWSWDPEGAGLFEELSPRSWASSGHNPVSFLQRVYPEDLEARAADADYVAKVERVLARMDDYLAEPSTSGRWLAASGATTPQEGDPSREHPVAYFCAEYGLHESLPIYSGGLGVLAGDHVKSASDLNLPFLGIGLFYRQGYMGQRLSPKGEQVEVELLNDPLSLPLDPVLGPTGAPLEISLSMPGRELVLRAWRVRVGRVSIYLLDSDVPSNRAEDRTITSRLYGGEAEMRLQQEIVLGRGGVRLLRALDVEPAVFHMNEGHAAFLTLERVRQATHGGGLSFEQARELVRQTTLFTTHTPVPAGHDRFDEDLMRRYFSDVPDWLGISWERFYGLGHARGEEQAFNMTYLAMGFSAFHNGVSRLHGEASRHLFRNYWPSLLESEVPVTTITNGIHLPTWVHPELARVVGAEQRHVLPEDFERELPAESLGTWWERKQALKSELFEELRQRSRRSCLERGDSPLLLERTLDGLDERALVIGFARRFAPYKRADLMFRDPERLLELLADEERPLRILVAGKAHPRDQLGKDILHSIAERTRAGDFVGRVLFLENYDIDLARQLMHGVDVWLNNPTRMLEASGTSGMKAAANGVLNLSIGDGWWPEAYDGRNGWLIGGTREYEDQELQDQLDSSVLYRLLEEEVLPAYFERDAAGLPKAWLERVAACLRTVPTQFNTDRMVAEYAREAYRPLAKRQHELRADPRGELARIVARDQHVLKGFAGLRIVSATVGDLGQARVGDAVEVNVEVDLGTLAPEDVVVELVLGHAKGEIDLGNPRSVALRHAGPTEGGQHAFEGTYELAESGTFSYGIRVRSSNEVQRELVLWA